MAKLAKRARARGPVARGRIALLHATAIAETPAEIARRYRRMADATRRLAWQDGRAEVKEAGLDLAMRWVVLADVVRRGRGSAGEA